MISSMNEWAINSKQRDENFKILWLKNSRVYFVMIVIDDDYYDDYFIMIILW